MHSKKYRLTARCLDRNNVIAYMATSNFGTVERLGREQVIELASRKEVINCEVHKSNGKEILCGKGINLKELPTIKEQKNGDDKVKIVARLMKNTRTIGYVVENSKKVKVRLKIRDIIELASKEKISNAIIVEHRGKKIIKGTNNTILSELPAINVENNEGIKIRKISITDSEIMGLVIDKVGSLTELGKLEESSSIEGIYEIVMKNVRLKVKLDNIEDETYSTMLYGSSIKAVSKNELTIVVCEENSKGILKINYKENKLGDVRKISRSDFMKIIVASFIKAYKSKKIVYSIILDDADEQRLGEYRFRIR